MQQSNLHRFHIPVMGLAFTIDSPLKVARFGISSVVSIVEDKLVEMMRRHYYTVNQLNYTPITAQEPDARARRITDYLNLLNRLVKKQVVQLRQSAFEKGSDIVKYFEMLPESNPLHQAYKNFQKAVHPGEKSSLENYLRTNILAGSIDVNIMTKVDRNADAVTALQGYADSELSNSSVIFSAGLNPRLFNFLGSSKAFEAKEDGSFDKKIVIKVSDYRSALIQGKYLAKKGRWISEFRIESGLNCGGHAFATDGILLGPILEEFKEKRQELTDTLFDIYKQCLVQQKKTSPALPPPIAFSVQGGIGTAAEDAFLHSYYNMDSTGWGTPFLLVPEATTVDKQTIELLCKAGEKDIRLSKSSPLGVRFHYLRGTSSDIERRTRIDKNNPGSPCTEKHLAFNTEFTKDPICTASKKYQRLKLDQLKTLGLPEAEYKRQTTEVLEKECLCVGLSNSAAINYEETFVNKLEAVTVCPGPNIVNFSRQVSLQTMTDHIYGRDNILTNPRRPHMFVAELHLYIDFLKEKITEDKTAGLVEKNQDYYHTFLSNLYQGIHYYRSLPAAALENPEQFQKDLQLAELELNCFSFQF